MKKRGVGRMGTLPFLYVAEPLLYVGGRQMALLRGQ